TLGAFVGTLAGGFLLLPRLGLLKATLLGAGTSFTVGILVWLVSEEKARPAPERASGRGAAPPAADRLASWILPLYAFSGCVAMVYEITWTRVLAPIAGASV